MELPKALDVWEIGFSTLDRSCEVHTKIWNGFTNRASWKHQSSLPGPSERSINFCGHSPIQLSSRLALVSHGPCSLLSCAGAQSCIGTAHPRSVLPPSWFWVLLELLRVGVPPPRCGGKLEGTLVTADSNLSNSLPPPVPAY